jgi:hypothetical protein
MILSNSGHFGRLTQGQSVWQADGNGGRPGDDATGCYPAYAQGVPQVFRQVFLESASGTAQDNRKCDF